MLGDLIVGAVDIIADIVIKAVTGSDDDDEDDADETGSEGGDTPG